MHQIIGRKSETSIVSVDPMINPISDAVTELALDRLSPDAKNRITCSEDRGLFLIMEERDRG
jgi:hypothetical protein